LNPRPETQTCGVYIRILPFDLARRAPDRRGSDEPACESFRLQPPTGKEAETILLVDALSDPARKNR
jgi:hypothetical protein